MSYKNIKAAAVKKFEPKSANSFFHFFFSVLMRTQAITHGTAKSQNSNSIINIYIIVDADTAFRWNPLIFSVVVSVNIDNRSGSKSYQERQIVRVKIAAGNDQINSVQLAFFIKIPEIFGFFVCNNHNTRLFSCIIGGICDGNHNVWISLIFIRRV